MKQQQTFLQRKLTKKRNYIEGRKKQYKEGMYDIIKENMPKEWEKDKSQIIIHKNGIRKYAKL